MYASAHTATTRRKYDKFLENSDVSDLSSTPSSSSDDR